MWMRIRADFALHRAGRKDESGWNQAALVPVWANICLFIVWFFASLVLIDIFMLSAIVADAFRILFVSLQRRRTFG
jgi:hypothetical protein